MHMKYDGKNILNNENNHLQAAGSQAVLHMLTLSFVEFSKDV